MMRKDLIILAVLVNAGLLAILFMLAINTDDDKISESIEVTQPIVVVQENEKPQELAIAAVPPAEPTLIADKTEDEMDHGLKEFADSPPVQQPIIVEEELPYASQENDDGLNEELPVVESKTPPQLEEKAKYVEITVKKGDVLEKIAKANGTTVAAIKEINQLKNERLKIGQVLRIPVSEKKQESSTTAKTTAPKKAPQASTAKSNDKKPSAEPQYYTVKNGDSPWKIAKQFNVKLDELLKLNNMSEEKARNLKVGDKIRVR